jgi:sulfur carrier protein
VKVVLRNPRREVEMAGPLTVSTLLERLELNPESVLVIQGDTLVTRDARLSDADVVEIRPVTSGGAARSVASVGRRRCSTSGATTPRSAATTS